MLFVISHEGIGEFLPTADYRGSVQTLWKFFSQYEKLDPMG
jgi:hypothetical protein